MNRFSLLLLLLGSRLLAANEVPDDSVLRLWTKSDVSYNEPGAGNPLVPGYFADPTIIEDDGVFYLYATSDLPKWDDINRLAVWSSTDFVNWRCQYLNWPDRVQCLSKTGNSAGVWAPSVVKANGRFYMYVSVGEEIWVGVADHPLGPWRNALPQGGPLVRHKAYYFVQTIDAECFIDTDGTPYLYWGSAYSGWQIEGRCLAVKLKADMVTFDGEPREVTPPHYFEAPYMLKRNGTYYLMYSWGFTWDESYQIRYATGATPFGPWTEGMMRPILGTDERDEHIKSTGHNTLLHHGGREYILYHRFNNLSYALSAKMRQVCADEMNFNADGSIQRVITTHRGVGLLGPVSVTPNLAEGKPTHASSDRDPLCRAAYATDNNNGTLWIGGTGKGEWIEVDLEAETPISRVELYPEFPIYPYHFRLETSLDGQHWTLLDDETANTRIGSPIVTHTPVRARYVRVTFATGEGDPRPALWELKIR